jgi:hypothetical protein
MSACFSWGSQATGETALEGDRMILTPSHDTDLRIFIFVCNCPKISINFRDLPFSAPRGHFSEYGQWSLRYMRCSVNASLLIDETIPQIQSLSEMGVSNLLIFHIYLFTQPFRVGSKMTHVCLTLSMVREKKKISVTKSSKKGPNVLL